MQKIIAIIKAILKPTYIYPILFSLFPILALYNANIEYVHYTAILRAIRINLIAVVLFLILANLLLRDHARAAIVVTYVVFLFFIYGHIFSYIDDRWPQIVQNRIFTGIWAVLIILGVWWLVKKFTKIEAATNFLTVVSVALFLIALINSITYEVQKLRTNLANRAQVTAQISEQLSVQPDEIPDIYLIVLDAHTRSDVLLDKFAHDNSAFIQELEDLGFFVGDCSQTNYWRTEYSLTSTLNLDYLQNFLEDPNLLPDWEYSVVRQTLDTLGYTTVAFESRATHNIDLGVDVLLSRRSKSFIYEDIYPFTNLNDFEVQLIKTTWLQSWLQLIANFGDKLPENLTLDAENAAYLEHYRQTLYILDELQRVPYMESPKFVMAHLLVPHEPFIFTPDGRYEYHHTSDEFKIGYRNNVEFIDNHLGEVLDNIITRSSVPPVIIVMGDHGPNGTRPSMLLPILNAYYIPKIDAGELYDRITPVNSFRMIFNAHFGTEYEILEDVSYYATGAEFADYELMPVICPGEK